MKSFFALFLLLQLAIIVLSHRSDVSEELALMHTQDAFYDRINKVICYLKPEYGKCRGRHQLWYFNKSKSKCEKFTYSTCGGNRNRFFTKDECDVFCTVRAKDWLKREKGAR